MRWAWSIGRIAGVDIRVHATMLLLFAWVAWSRFAIGGGWNGALHGMLFLLLLFGIVVLHELGHALAARRYGIATRNITLLPIGGIAALERMPDDPRKELVVALAGPAVNFALAGILLLAILGSGGTLVVTDVVRPGQAVLAQLFWINVVLGGFNLLPAYPMDGGRALRALLAMRLGNVRATQTAASIGQGMALVFGVLGLFYSPWLLFIALFVWLGATSEAKLYQLEDALDGIPIEYVMRRRVETLAPTMWLTEATDRVIHGVQQDFPVVENGRPVGMLTRRALMEALLEQNPRTLVADLMRADVPIVEEHAMLEDAFERLRSTDLRSLPVVDHSGRLVGLVSMDTIGELLLIHSTLRQRGRTDNRGRDLGAAWDDYRRGAAA